MKTKIFNAGEKKICYIDAEDFEKEVEEGTIKVIKEYPNWRYKECEDSDYILMNPEDWIIEVSSREINLGQKYRYSLHSKIGWFPDEPIAKYKKISTGYQGKLTRYKIEFDEDIGFEEGCANVFTNVRDGQWREKLTAAGFKVVDIN